MLLRKSHPVPASMAAAAAGLALLTGLWLGMRGATDQPFSLTLGSLQLELRLGSGNAPHLTFKGVTP